MEFGDRSEYIKKGKFIGKENCPFCKTDEPEKQYIIGETKYWIIRHNKYPYFGNKNHLISAPKKHKTFTTQLSKNEFADMKEVEKFVKEFYNGDEYFCFIREGIGGRSVEHLHYHFIPGTVFPEEKEGQNYLRIKN